MVFLFVGKPQKSHTSCLQMTHSYFAKHRKGDTGSSGDTEIICRSLRSVHKYGEVINLF